MELSGILNKPFEFKFVFNFHFLIILNIHKAKYSEAKIEKIFSKKKFCETDEEAKCKSEFSRFFLLFAFLYFHISVFLYFK